MSRLLLSVARSIVQKRSNIPESVLKYRLSTTVVPQGLQEVADYATSQGVVFIHREGTQGYKAGNLNLGFSQSRGEYS